MRDPTRAFVWGVMAGLLITIGSFVLVAEITGVRFQLIYVQDKK